MIDIELIAQNIAIVGALGYIAHLIVKTTDNTEYNRRITSRLSQLETDIDAELGKLKDFSMQHTGRYRHLSYALKRIKETDYKTKPADFSAVVEIYNISAEYGLGPWKHLGPLDVD